LIPVLDPVNNGFFQGQANGELSFFEYPASAIARITVSINRTISSVVRTLVWNRKSFWDPKVLGGYDSS
jgi:hypothetical protein